MEQSRAFSDTEIVTIAAVAAAALGGIVVGLGRGQENQAENQNGASELTGKVTSFVSDSVEKLPTSAPQVSIDVDGIRRSLNSGTNAARSGAERTRDALQTAGRNVRGQYSDRSRSFTDALKAAATSALEARNSNGSAKEASPQSIDVAAIVRGFMRSNSSNDSATSGTDENQRDLGQLLAAELASIEATVRAAPEAVRSSADPARSVVSERLAQPVSNAMRKSGDVAKDSVVSLAWLSLGAAVVYFGLLSDDRREQVKDGICGAIEQLRLLGLDLQGYEPEM